MSNLTSSLVHQHQSWAASLDFMSEIFSLFPHTWLHTWSQTISTPSTENFNLLTESIPQIFSSVTDICFRASLLCHRYIIQNNLTFSACSKENKYKEYTSDLLSSVTDICFRIFLLCHRYIIQNFTPLSQMYASDLRSSVTGICLRTSLLIRSDHVLWCGWIVSWREDVFTYLHALERYEWVPIVAELTLSQEAGLTCCRCPQIKIQKFSFLLLKRSWRTWLIKIIFLFFSHKHEKHA